MEDASRVAIEKSKALGFSDAAVSIFLEPKPSSSPPSNPANPNRSFDIVTDLSRCGQCHGCGRLATEEELKKCARCKRVFYCDKSCQSSDWRTHKRQCMEGLLEAALNNLRRSSMSMCEKTQLLLSGQGHLVPNGFLNQTMAKVGCPTAAEFLSSASAELEEIISISQMSIEQARGTAGNSLTAYVEHERWGLDPGVHSLCLSLNMWPGVFTIESCSGLHALCLAPILPLVSFVSDDASALSNIQGIVEKGALGIRFCCGPSRNIQDAKDLCGLATIDCDLGPNKPSLCRTFMRQVRVSATPSDQLDDALLKDSNLLRIQHNMIGNFGLALNLLKGNSSITLSTNELEVLGNLEAKALELRVQLIESGNKKYRLK